VVHVVVVVDANRGQPRFKKFSTLGNIIFVRIILTQWNCKLETSPVGKGHRLLLQKPV